MCSTTFSLTLIFAVCSSTNVGPEKAVLKTFYSSKELLQSKESLLSWCGSFL
ncbi:hypothetical protein EXN66_Car008437 [Channa argus]|uniref:Uncharacterized protein n=1 Tax=Channa argus TaxID=215402 RepID=A0A6G1PQY8_CHAAH|nr:hypothetical protein EXN66_Car008437 [Channa argus]